MFFASRLSPLLLTGLAWACGSEPNSDESGAGSGSVAASAGGNPAGGSRAAGGSANSATGGVPAPTGGAASTGGASASGGAPSTGGVPVAGGVTSTGGVIATGGVASTGGVTSTGSGGSPASGGRGGAAGNAATGGEPASGGRSPVSLFLAGDSTVSTYRDTTSTTDQAGWGQMLGALFDATVRVENRAVGGMTARHFIENGYLDQIFDDAKSGDYLFVQFGTNDGNKTATYELDGQTIPYFLDPATDFKDYVKRYIDGARERGLTPVLVTPPPRNSAYCTGGNGTGAHATALRELGAAESVAVSDLNEKSVEYLKAICPAPTPEDFFLLRADGSVDGTHFQENGARKLAELVAEGLREAGVPVAERLK
jgi:lysophospholipase L1-like esterase